MEDEPHQEPERSDAADDHEREGPRTAAATATTWYPPRTTAAGWFPPCTMAFSFTARRWPGVIILVVVVIIAGRRRQRQVLVVVSHMARNGERRRFIHPR